MQFEATTKNESRIEAFFCVYSLAMLAQALVERELPRGMGRARVAELPIYPEDRACQQPTAEQIFRLFSLTARHAVLAHGTAIRVLPPELTELQRQVLRLMNIPTTVFAAPR